MGKISYCGKFVFNQLTRLINSVNDTPNLQRVSKKIMGRPKLKKYLAIGSPIHPINITSCLLTSSSGGKSSGIVFCRNL